MLWLLFLSVEDRRRMQRKKKRDTYTEDIGEYTIMCVR